MDTPGVSPPGRRSSSSFSPVGLHVLVVDDDPLCLMVLERMLRQCSYKVTTCNRVAQALALLRDNKDNYDIVMSDVYMPGEDGFQLLEIIGLELDLPVIMMSANGETSVVMKGITHGACDYLIKPVRMEELRNIWQHVLRRKGRDSPVEDYSGEWDESMRFGDYPDSGSKKRKDLVESSEEDVVDDVSSLKKARVNWSVQLHQQFVNAVNQLGVEKAVPKRILEIMNVQGLTRENVASHLQKYRLYLKRLSGVVPEPCPVASFQASEGGRLGGSMRVVSAGKGSTVSSRVKGLNLGGGLGGISGAGRRIDSGTQTALAQYKAHLQKQAANRAQVLGGLGLLHKKEQNASRDINTSGGLHRMSSLDLGFLLKAERDEDVDQWKGLDSLDDLAAYSFRDAVKLEDTATGTRQKISRTNTSGASSAGLSLKSVAEEQLETLYTCTLRTSDKERDRAKLGMLKIQESLPASIEDTSSSTNLPPARHTVTATSRETFAAADLEAVGELPIARLEFYPGTPLDISDYLLEEDFLYQG